MSQYTSSAAPAAREVAARLARPVARGELFLWLSAALFVNQAIQLLSFDSRFAFINSLAIQNYVYWFGCFVTMYRLSRSEVRVPAKSDWVFAIAMLLALLAASFIGYRFSIGVIATVFAFYLLLDRGDRELKAASTVLLALSVHLVWGPIVFQFLTPELLRADAALVGSMLKLVRSDIVWNDTTFYATPDFAISLVGACSSFHNLSTAVLACVSATMFMRTGWTSRDIPRILVAIAIMIFMNDARICLLAWGPAAYAFWHDGAGAPLLEFLMTATLLVIAFGGAARRSSRG